MVLHNLSPNGKLHEYRIIPIPKLKRPSSVQVLGFSVYHKPWIIKVPLVNKGVRYEVDKDRWLHFIKYSKGLVIAYVRFLHVLGL